MKIRLEELGGAGGAEGQTESRSYAASDRKTLDEVAGIVSQIRGALAELHLLRDGGCGLRRRGAVER